MNPNRCCRESGAAERLGGRVTHYQIRALRPVGLFGARCAPASEEGTVSAHDRPPADPRAGRARPGARHVTSGPTRGTLTAGAGASAMLPGVCRQGDGSPGPAEARAAQSARGDDATEACFVLCTNSPDALSPPQPQSAGRWVSQTRLPLS